MRNHSDYFEFIGSKMKRTVAAFCKPFGFSLKLGEQPFQRNFTSRENTQIPVHREHIFFGVHRQSCADGNSFLPPGGEPFGDFPLSESDEHSLFYHSWQ